MQDERAESLIGYFACIADENDTWYSTVNFERRAAEYLFGVLSIPGLTEDAFKKWLKTEKISPSVNMDHIRIIFCV